MYLFSGIQRLKRMKMLLRLHIAHAFVSKCFDSPYLWKQSCDYLITCVQTRKWLQTRTLKRSARRRHKVTKRRKKISSGLMMRQSYCCYTTRSNSTLHIYIIFVYLVYMNSKGLRLRRSSLW